MSSNIAVTSGNKPMVANRRPVCPTAAALFRAKRRSEGQVPNFSECSDYPLWMSVYLARKRSSAVETLESEREAGDGRSTRVNGNELPINSARSVDQNYYFRIRAQISSPISGCLHFSAKTSQNILFGIRISLDFGGRLSGQPTS